MLQLNITNETSQLKAVVLGIANSNGSIPKLEDCYDPKSREHVLNGTYPKEEDMIEEMEAVAAVFKKYDIAVYRPKVIKNYNQIFSRDIAFVIEDKLIKANILPDREKEYIAIQHVTNQINPINIIELPKECHIEGGDVMPWNEYIFVGTYSGVDYADFITARTNKQAVFALQELFPNKIVKSFELRKHNLTGRLGIDTKNVPVDKRDSILKIVMDFSKVNMKIVEGDDHIDAKVRPPIANTDPTARFAGAGATANIAFKYSEKMWALRKELERKKAFPFKLLYSI